MKTLANNHHHVTAASYTNIGAAYNYKKEYNNAIDYYYKSIEIQLKILGYDHPNTETSYTNIGSVYNYKGEYDNAIDYYKKSIEIR